MGNELPETEVEVGLEGHAYEFASLRVIDENCTFLFVELDVTPFETRKDVVGSVQPIDNVFS